ncbi:MAG TPA: 50S ribosomal protein L2 [Opitutales bacterium]|nr:50S ribosomal protein L2 [Opitutales bacterium]
MALIQKRPLTPGQRFHLANKSEVTKETPEKSLLISIKKSGGRNCYGRVTSRRIGGGHKKLFRLIDFKRERYDQAATVVAIEYDPNRSALIALVSYEDGEKRYILSPKGLKVGDKITSSKGKLEYNVGNNMPLSEMPPSIKIHAIELKPDTKATIARTAGTSAQLVGVEGEKAMLRMPSGEIRYVLAKCRATIGEVGNEQHQNESLGKAGRARWLGRRSVSRGVARNPVDHPMGGGQGKTSGGGHPVSPWGQLAKGKPTRVRSKITNNMIVVRRNGRKVKK